jgi:hypoxanthine phosphoribosyltransferase
MNRIKLHDKWFKLYKSAEELDTAIQKVADKLNTDLKDVKEPIFLSVLNGSFMFTSDLMKKLDVVADLMFIKLSSYCGTTSTGEVKQIMGLNKSVEGRTVIVVEDIVETGNTIVELHKILKEAGASDVKICTLLLKPNAYKKDINIDYAALSIPDDFIVGYGLDYNDLGRQYKDLYVIDQQ